MTIEAVLIAIVLMGVVISISQYFKSHEVVAQLVSVPWENLSGMIADGVWMPPQKAAANHPLTFYRSVTLQGVPPKKGQ